MLISMPWSRCISVCCTISSLWSSTRPWWSFRALRPLPSPLSGAARDRAPDARARTRHLMVIELQRDYRVHGNHLFDFPLVLLCLFVCVLIVSCFLLCFLETISVGHRPDCCNCNVAVARFVATELARMCTPRAPSLPPPLLGLLQYVVCYSMLWRQIVPTLRFQLSLPRK